MIRGWHWLAFGTLLATSRAAESTPARIGDAWSDPANPIVRAFGGRRLDLWSLRPLRQPTTPESKSADREPAARHPIDRFLGAKLATMRLSFSPEADRRTLLRRVTFDLTGLPPTPGAVSSFVDDPSPSAYERVVDRLLASPRHGEHQARLWLDVIRYSDSNGFDWDEFRPQAWRFRDYVIRSLNADKPFDRFIREQLAGDEIYGHIPRDSAARDALIATGFLRLGPQDNAAPLFNEQDRARAELMSDLVETTGSAFLGMTMACCRCHDHKFDPLSQEDHYRLRAFFEPVKAGDDISLDLAAVQSDVRAHNAALEQRIQTHATERTEVRKPFHDWLREQHRQKLSPDERRLLDSSPTNLTTEIKERLQALQKKVAPSESDVTALLPLEIHGRNAAWEAEIATLRRQMRSFTKGLLTVDADGPPKPTHVLAQGNHQQPRQAVEPGILSALDPNPARIKSPANSASTGRRLTLADWIASPDNPLTARVLVNRVWQQHFGRGLVATANDFGLAGARPTHAELLDWLASDFIQHGWSLKALHRRIVTSAAYRQSSHVRPDLAVVDPENALLWRQNPRRLSAEQLRDTLLVTAGTLRLVEGGPPVWPELPADVLQANPAFLDDNETRTKGWYPSPPLEQFVRSVFLVQKRTVRVPFMETFDLPENSSSCGRRVESTVAPQALTLLNEPFAAAAARDFAARLQRHSTKPEGQISAAFQLALQREPAPEEVSACRRLLDQRSLVELCRALLNLNEFIYVD